ncbi:MAG TPA: MerR family transcriptional regulator [Actinomycetota bacterium]|nr:MerR family transcriptional regulator [Actinomycetota bacterium]
MPLSRSRDYLSIGEVLEQVREEFPDVSISKIRFLEAEGLIAPERTGSGYRKFYEPDVRRIRFILSLQRDHFLPLRVIRERLDEVDRGGGDFPVAPNGAGPAGAEVVRKPAAEPAANLLGVQLSREELRSSSGLAEDELSSLEEFGLLPRRDLDLYDEHDLLVATAAKKFFSFGIEARHLRMYRQFAEREAAFFEQIVTPVARRRDSGAGKEASRSVRELASLSRQMREGMLATSLRDLL